MGVEPLDTVRYESVGTRSSVSSTFEDPPASASLLVVVTDSEGVYLWTTGTCGEGARVTRFDLEPRDRGPWGRIGCSSVDEVAGR